MSKDKQSKPFLRDHVRHAIQDHLERLEGTSLSDLYNLVLSEVELPLLETVMEHAKGNQTKASEWLGLNRATLKKLLVKYGIV